MEEDKDSIEIFYRKKVKRSIMVSVIIPVYNVSKYIERCARSLFEQSLQEIEFIFVDDASPDNSIEILSEVLSQYPSRQNQVKIIAHDKNKGIVAARNTGMRFAQGEYIAHCDSDDWVELDMYERLYAEAKCSSADLVACDFVMEYASHSAIYGCNPSMHDKVTLLKTYIGSGWTVMWNKLAHRDLYYKHDVWGYEGYDFCEDYGTSVRLLYYSQCYRCVHLPLYHYNRSNVESTVRTYNKKKERNQISQITIYDKINHFFVEHGLFQDLEDVLSWRILCAKRDWLYNSSKWDNYLGLCPESNKWIDSNPLCSNKDKFCQHVILYPYLRWIILLVGICDKIIKSLK